MSGDVKELESGGGHRLYAHRIGIVVELVDEGPKSTGLTAGK
jgi:hypothetical protein